jgi:N-acylglucosamine-6-phosphate 2-epimerase
MRLVESAGDLKKGKGMTIADLKDRFRGGLIVSCQALPGEPLYSTEGGVMPLLAIAAERAGAVGIRSNSARDVREIKSRVNLPVIGLIKRHIPDYEPFITPTLDDVDALAAAGADMIAFDSTLRTRADGLVPKEFVAKIRARYPDLPLMADIATLEEGMEAALIGVDFVGTTLSGWTAQSVDAPTPNFELVARLADCVSVPIIAEGGIRTPDQARIMLEMGALCVVVGGAITRPMEIAMEFVKAMSKARARDLGGSSYSSFE